MGVRHTVHAHGHGHPATAAHAAHARPHLGQLHLEGKLRREIELLPLAGGLNATLLQHCLPAVAGVDKWVGPLNAACQRYGINKSLRRVAAFLGQTAHESSNLAQLEEKMRYTTTEQLKKIFKVFKTDEEATPYLRNAEKLANKVYAGRGGNGDTASGDGWRYRGRGLIHLTGKDNYAAFAKDTKVDAVNKPELVSTPEYAALSAGWFWHKNHLNELADAEQYQALTRRINKSKVGFPLREARRQTALNALCYAAVVNLTMAASFGRPRSL